MTAGNYLGVFFMAVIQQGWILIFNYYYLNIRGNLTYRLYQ